MNIQLPAAPAEEVRFERLRLIVTPIWLLACFGSLISIALLLPMPTDFASPMHAWLSVIAFGITTWAALSSLSFTKNFTLYRMHKKWLNGRPNKRAGHPPRQFWGQWSIWGIAAFLQMCFVYAAWTTEPPAAPLVLAFLLLPASYGIFTSVRESRKVARMKLHREPLLDECYVAAVRAVFLQANAAVAVFVIRSKAEKLWPNARVQLVSANPLTDVDNTEKSYEVTFTDTMLELMTPDELAAVCLHELGHGELQTPQNAQLLVAGCMVAMSVASLAVPYWIAMHLQWQPGTPQFTPIWALCIGISLIALRLTELFAKRRGEYQCDGYAADRVENVSSLTQALTKSCISAKLNPSHSRLYEMLFEDHPSIANRIAYVNERWTKRTKKAA